VGAGESNEKEAVLTSHASELSASVKGLETDKERLMREVATMTVSMKSLQEELATTQDERKKAGNGTMTMMVIWQNIDKALLV
jgi:outer membrane murein-binding lipoprotein Lpp